MRLHQKNKHSFITLTLLIFCLCLSFVQNSFAGFAITETSSVCTVPSDFSSIQSAVDEPTCSTIKIAPGIYNENLDIRRNVTIEGFLANAEMNVIDGSALGSVFSITAGTTTLKNLTITNGHDIVGAGIYAYGASLELDNVNIINNVGGEYASGAGLFIYGTELHINNSKFIGNNSEYKAGAIYNLTETATIQNTLFENNSANSIAGAIYTADNTLEITNSLFINNSTETSGAAIYGSNATIEIEGTHFLRNSSDDNGAGLYLSHSTANIDTSVFNENGFNVLFITNSEINVSNSEFYDNSGYEDAVVLDGYDSTASFLNTDFYEDRRDLTNLFNDYILYGVSIGFDSCNEYLIP